MASTTRSPSTADEAIPVLVGIDAPASCPVAAASATADASATNVGVCGRSIQTGEITGEFTLDGDGDPGDGFDPIRRGQRGVVYRFHRDDVEPCPCEMVERFDVPVTGVNAEAGTLYLTFTAEPARARDVVRHLQDVFESITVRRPRLDPAEAPFALVDLGRLTDRQFEVLERAYELGYFDFPKGANASDVAEDLGIARSTFSEHLAAALGKVVGSAVAGPPADLRGGR
ncbi:MAG: helix-turn-helix domain-containing protein [Halobacteriales archaeon]